MSTPEASMSNTQRFKLVYSKMQEVLEDDAQKEPQRAKIAIRHGCEVSREEIEEIAKLREIVLETASPDPVSFTTT
ncbi:MAG: hypothetical protein IT449_12140 [Phycisphaerales bacterium]|nr:hypothetical protein [Phycisphaerales bacterium]